jgi:hypothetical protein
VMNQLVQQNAKHTTENAIVEQLMRAHL